MTSISPETIIQCLHTNYGIAATTLQFLPLGADMNASVYKVETKDKAEYFIKLKLNYNHTISMAIAKLLSKSGIQQMIVPIHTKHGQQFHRIGDHILIVYPYIEGEDGFHRDLTDDQWRLLGKALRQVHDFDVPMEIQRKIRQEDYSNRWRTAVGLLMQSIDASPCQDEATRAFMLSLRDKQETIHRLIDRAEALSRMLKSQSMQYVLCHADIHGGNVLIDRSHAIYIVDWDEPMMAPKERDLMFIGGGVANVWNKPHEEEWFYEGYGTIDVNWTIVAYYRHERIVEDIAEFYQGMHSPTTTSEDKQVMYQHFSGMFKPDGVVEIAFRT